MDRDKNLMEEGPLFNKIGRGMVLKGEVISYLRGEVIVNINYFCDGIIKKEELSKEKYNKGDVIYVYVMSLDDGDGNILLSEKKALYKKGLEDIKSHYKNKESIFVTIKDEIDSGVICTYSEVRGFIPRSMKGSFDFKNNKDKEVEVHIVEFDINKNKFIFSRREVEEREIKERKIKRINSLSEGNKLLGIVENIKDYGIFVDIGDVKGLVHKNEITYKRKFNINDIVRIGDKVEVYVLSIDKDNLKVSLTMKDLNYDVFKENAHMFKEGSNYDVYVIKVLPSGLVVSLNEYINGFIHINEISFDSISSIRDFKVNDKLKAKIIKIDYDNEKVFLSLLNTDDEDESFDYIEESLDNTLGDMFKDIFSKLK